MAQRLRDVGEHAWIARLLRGLPVGRRTLLGPGDDAAVLRLGRRPLVVTTDALIEGVHFRAGWESPQGLGRRAFRVNLSDMAAMGARPIAVLVALEAPPDTPVPVLDGVMRGIARDARRSGADVVGGNVAAGTHLAITITLLGECPGPVVRRAGARVGDAVYVTGRLGGAAAAIARLDAGVVRRPPVPVRAEAGVLLAAVAGAMIDVSDGLLQDLGHVCRASSVGAELDAASIPIAPTCRALGGDALRLALTGGEDYELLFTVPARRETKLRRMTSRLGCRVTRIGRITAGRPVVRVRDGDRRLLLASGKGFDHFAR